MDNVDLSVLRSAIDWRSAGHRVTLGTVVRTWGSAPRPVGAMVVIRDDGQIVGSVSGGCVEDDLVEKVMAGKIAAEHPEIATYGVKTDAQRWGLPCGGTLHLVFETLSDASRLEELERMISRHELAVRTLDLATGKVSLQPGNRNDTLSFDGSTLRTIHGPQYRLLLIGAGQVSQYLASMAQMLGYQVTVCDPREEYASGYSDVRDVTFTREMPDDAVVAMEFDTHTACVALTHEPKLDDLALMEALKSPAFYVGALGSRANNDKRRTRLAEFDLSESEIARLHGPVGLYLGSKTPPEIAVSVLAEMTAVRNGVGIVQSHAAKKPPVDVSACAQTT